MRHTNVARGWLRRILNNIRGGVGDARISLCRTRLGNIYKAVMSQNRLFLDYSTTVKKAILLLSILSYKSYAASAALYLH